MNSIAQIASSDAFRRHLTDLLVKVCAINTVPRADVAATAQAESQVFDLVTQEVKGFGLKSSRCLRLPINPSIAQHPFFSQPYYTRTPENPAGLPVEPCYADRCNLVIEIDGDQREPKGVGQALNAHIDVVAPYFPPRIEGNVVFGRGTCDDKGSVVAIVGALKLLAEHLRVKRGCLNRDLTCMIVIDEEPGGNGSLSLAIDRELKRRYDSMIVLECADGGIHPGNRGCVWFKIEGELPGSNLFEAALYIIDELEKEGRAIRAESNHPLFPHRPVQTCHGIIGNCGEHPSRINGDVSFEIVFDRSAPPAGTASFISDIIEDGLKQYIGLYGDKTQVMDPTTGKPKVDHHYDLTPTPQGWLVRVWGSTGHMGSIFENDGAITKMATIGRALIRSRAAIEQATGTAMRLRLSGWPDESRILMEGGQGFLPTHSMRDVQERLRAAALRGGQYYLDLVGTKADAKRIFQVTFEKLHNAAFDGDPNSTDMLNAIEAAKRAGTWKDGPIRGWDVSCDARIFACEYPGLPVITTGPGLIRHAHSDQEQIDMRDVARTSEFLAHFILKQTGTL
ncbi:MAG: M20/M25/M40 family metallo-hydrolase [Phycisphaerae bacterium]